LAGPPAAPAATDTSAELAEREKLNNAFELVRQGKASEAEAIFSAVIAEYDRKAQPGMIYRCASDPAHALETLLGSAVEKPDKSVVVLGPNWCDALFGEGFALIDLNRANEAEAFLAHAVEMNPNNAHYLNEYAEWYKSHHQWQKAHDLFAHAWDIVDHDKKGPDRRIAARALRGMGFTQIELGDYNDAEKLFKRSLDYEPEKQDAVAGELQYIADQRKKTN
jgi:tetratricopeptide (TPR) repeat protein